MKLSEYSQGAIAQYAGKLEFTEEQLKARVREYLVAAPGHLYHGDIVCKDIRSKTRPRGYFTSEGVSFCSVIANCVLDFGLNIPPERECCYSKGKRQNVRAQLSDIVGDMEKMKQYFHSAFRREERMCRCMFAAGIVDGFEVADYQVPTSSGGHDKIDLILKCNGSIFVTEVKYFGSNESFLRCALEIETYYKKLNEQFFKLYDCTADNLRKAVLIDKDSFAYSQLREEWARKLRKEFEIDVLELSADKNSFHIVHI